MSNPWDKWAKRPTPELVSRLIDLTSLVLSEVDEDEFNEDLPGTGRVIGTLSPGMSRTDIIGVMTKVRDYTSEAHWISEELEHRIRKTEYSGLNDIEIVFLP